MLLKKIHLWVGIVGILLFLLSGQYFQHALDGLQNLQDTHRLLLRTSHVYFFFSSFINLLFGLFFDQSKKIRWYTIINQSLIIFSPFLIGYGFVFETSGDSGIERELGSWGVIILFIWLLNTCVGKLVQFATKIRSQYSSR